jgi:uncharacterized coiled-coil protein SlyX
MLCYKPANTAADLKAIEREVCLFLFSMHLCVISFNNMGVCNCTQMKRREDAHKKELKDAEAKVKEEKERSDRDMKEKKEVIAKLEGQVKDQEKLLREANKLSDSKQDKINTMTLELSNLKGKLSALQAGGGRSQKNPVSNEGTGIMGFEDKVIERVMLKEVDFLHQQRMEGEKQNKRLKGVKNMIQNNPLANSLYGGGSGASALLQSLMGGNSGIGGGLNSMLGKSLLGDSSVRAGGGMVIQNGSFVGEHALNMHVSYVCHQCCIPNRYLSQSFVVI